MKETEKHQKAFEIYYEYRSILKVHEKMGISRQAIHKWSLAFGWKERCNVREKDINKGIDEKFVAGVVDKKAKMLEELDKLDLMVDQEVITAFTQDPGTGKYIPKFQIEKLKDFVDIIGLKLRIHDNRLKVLGEDIQKVQHSGEIKLYDFSTDKYPGPETASKTA